MDSRRLLRAGGLGLWLWRAAAVLAALLLTAAMLRVLGRAPSEALCLADRQALCSPAKWAMILTAWAPLLLCSAGLLVTFTAGLWNIGVEGQVLMGAVWATAVMRVFDGILPPPFVLLFAAAAGVAGGAGWGVLAGALKVHGKVHEIFGGLGLNFVAGAGVLYLVFGPWRRPGIASTSGTEPFAESLWLPAFRDFSVSPIEVALALAGLLAVAFLLRGSYFGLRLKAVGRNVEAARLLGVSTGTHVLAAFALCGALAGLAGWLLVAGAGSRHNLYPLISGGYGFQGILVVLVASFSAFWCAPVALFFAALAMGSYHLDSALAGVIQGLLVLSLLAVSGLRERWRRAEA